MRGKCQFGVWRWVASFARAKSARTWSDSLKTAAVHAPWLSHLDRVDPAGRAKVFIGIKVGPARRVTRLGGSPLYLSQPLLSLVDGSPRCVRKCMKSRLAQDSSGRRVTLLQANLNSPYIKSLTLPVSDLSLLIIFPVSSSFSSSISLISLTSVALVLETLLLKDHSESPGSSRK